MEKEIIVLNEERNVSLTAYTLEVGGKFDYVVKRPAVLILPGGGYEYCSKREADPVALAYLQAGYQAFILNYSVAEHSVWPNPLDDVEMAMELIRTREDWNVYSDKIAVVGFSAGGHLAAAAATMSRNRPNAAILGYALVGEDVKCCNLTAPDTTKYVDENTCPCFVFSSRMDEVVLVQNSIDFISALNKANVAFESHIYAYGPHGFSTCNSSIFYRGRAICERTENWVDDSIGWLKDIFGDFDEKKMSEPKCRPHFNGNNDEYLSIDCTIGHLLKNPDAREAMGEWTHKIEENTEMLNWLQKMSMRSALGFERVSEEIAEEMNQRLKKIPNK